MRGGRISAFGFTLIELLTVVAIIAIIAAMMMPVLSRARATADDTKCASNLRQIGMGILSYARDHDGSLPGRTSPDWTSQPHGILLGVYAYSWAGGNDPFGLQWWIASYLDVDKKNQWKTTQDVLMCPVYTRLIGPDLSKYPGYVLNPQVPSRNDTLMHQPFGYPDKLLRGSNLPMHDINPWKVTQLADIGDANGNGPSRIWMMKDADALDPLFKSTAYYGTLPKQMFHIDHRNALFFDFHVGKVDAQNAAE